MTISKCENCNRCTILEETISRQAEQLSDARRQLRDSWDKCEELRTRNDILESLNRSPNKYPQELTEQVKILTDQLRQLNLTVINLNKTYPTAVEQIQATTQNNTYQSSNPPKVTLKP